MNSTLIHTTSVSSLLETGINTKMSNPSPPPFAEGEYKIFHSLAGKVIIKHSLNENVHIRFPNEDIFQKYLTNYAILKNYLQVPEIIHTNFNEFIVEQKFISAKEHNLSMHETFRFVDLLEKITQINPISNNLPLLKMVSSVNLIIENCEYWNRFTENNKLNSNQVNFLSTFLLQIGTEIDAYPRTTIYRDLNLTNILECSETEKLYLIDYENLSFGPYLLDLCFLLTDKYFFHNDVIIETAVEKFTQTRKLNISEVRAHFSITSLFLNLQWLFQMVSLSYKKNVFFQLDLRMLIVQVLRSVLRAEKYISPHNFFQLLEIAQTLMKGFIEGYSFISQTHDLPVMPSELFLNSVSEIFRCDNDQTINLKEIRLKIRKDCIDWFFHIESNEKDCQFVFNGIENDIHPKLKEKKMVKEFNLWYHETISEEKIMVCTLLHSIISQKQKIVKLNLIESQLAEDKSIINFILSTFPFSRLTSELIGGDFEKAQPQETLTSIYYPFIEGEETVEAFELEKIDKF